MDLFLSSGQVQNEMLKRWRRWKLGKDIEEEYRHTHSQTPHAKSGSSAVPLPPDRSETPEPPESAPPSEESRRLVISCHRNGMGMARGRGRAGLCLASEPHEGASNCSSLTEDICLEERLHCTDCPSGVDECDV